MSRKKENRDEIIFNLCSIYSSTDLSMAIISKALEISNSTANSYLYEGIARSELIPDLMVEKICNRINTLKATSYCYPNCKKMNLSNSLEKRNLRNKFIELQKELQISGDANLIFCIKKRIKSLEH